MKFILYLETNKMPVSLTGIIDNNTISEGDTLVFKFPNGKSRVLLAQKTKDGTVILPPSEVSEATASVYSFIVSFMKDNGYPPTIREIAEGVGLSSTSTIHHHLRKLQSKELITVVDQSPRAMRVSGYRYTKEEK